jgi:hypothetical protein
VSPDCRRGLLRRAALESPGDLRMTPGVRAESPGACAAERSLSIAFESSAPLSRAGCSHDEEGVQERASKDAQEGERPSARQPQRSRSRASSRPYQWRRTCRNCVVPKRARGGQRNRPVDLARGGELPGESAGILRPEDLPARGRRGRAPLPEVDRNKPRWESRDRGRRRVRARGRARRETRLGPDQRSEARARSTAAPPDSSTPTCSRTPEQRIASKAPSEKGEAGAVGRERGGRGGVSRATCHRRSAEESAAPGSRIPRPRGDPRRAVCRIRCRGRRGSAGRRPLPLENWKVENSRTRETRPGLPARGPRARGRRGSALPRSGRRKPLPTKSRDLLLDREAPAARGALERRRSAPSARCGKRGQASRGRQSRRTSVATAGTA